MNWMKGLYYEMEVLLLLFMTTHKALSECAVVCVGCDNLLFEIGTGT
jgi:hypothetical protein